MRFIVVAEGAARAAGRMGSRWVGSVHAATLEEAQRIAAVKWPTMRLTVTAIQQPLRPSMIYREPE
jgi:hypothetical protein